jgi:23S rRNA G2445 N2-methylase RlmL
MDFNKKQTLVVITSPALAEHLQAELESLNFPIDQFKETSIHTKGTLNDAITLNLNLRCGLYVHCLLGQFKCSRPGDLYKQIKEIAWEDIIPADEYISVISRVETESVDNTMYPSLVVKDAIADRMTEKTGNRPDSGPERENIVVNLYWRNDDCWVYLNTSGRKLSDRNYRKMPFKAPLQECLAAAIIKSTGYDGSQTGNRSGTYRPGAGGRTAAG